MKKLQQLYSQTRLTAAGVLLALFATPQMAFALGGLDKAKTAADDIKTGLYAVVGVLAVIYLIWLGVMAFAEKKSWSDFGWGIIYVSLVGAASAIAGWAWTLFV